MQSRTQQLEAHVEIKLGYLRQQINIGLTQLDEGQGVTIETRESFSCLMEAICHSDRSAKRGAEESHSTKNQAKPRI